MITFTDVMYGFGQIIRGELPTALFGALQGTASGGTRAGARARAVDFANEVIEEPYHFQVEPEIVSQELVARIDDEDLGENGKINLCGPAAFMHVYGQRDPMGYVEYTLGLYTHGRGLIGRSGDDDSIGGLVIEPDRDIKETRMYGSEAKPRTTPPTPANPREFQTQWGLGAVDFITMASLRDDQNLLLDFDSPDDALAGINFPEEVSSWLNATGLYSTVSSEGNWFRNGTFDHAEGLDPDPAQRDILLLIQTWAMNPVFWISPGNLTVNLADANSIAATGTSLLEAFPNHFVVLTSAITELPNGLVDLEFWTWGEVRHYQITKAVFEANYYGAIVAELA